MESKPTEISIIGPREDLLLETFKGEEALGQPYRYDLTLLSDDHAIPVTDLLGKPLTVCFTPPASPSAERETRYFDGIVTYFAKIDTTIRHARYLVILAPKLSRLGYTHNCRIFNDASNANPDPEKQQALQDTLTIVKKVLAGREVTLVDDETKNNHVGCDRRYCVQYRETDLNFVQRLLEEEGIYYFFRHEEGKHTMVLVDSTSSHAKVDGYDPVLYLPHENKQIITDEHFWSLKVSGSLFPGKYSVLQGYDHTQIRPVPAQIVEQLSVLDQPGAKFEVYDYPGSLFEKDLAQQDALVRMQGDRTKNTCIEVDANTIGLGVGNLVKLAKPSEALRSPFWTEADFDKDYLITQAKYSFSTDQHATGNNGAANLPFHAHFTLLDTEIQFRPKRFATKPHIEGPQTAVVVGSEKDEEDDEAQGSDGASPKPAAAKKDDKKEEIYTDKLGRVKVKFHWDRSNRRNQLASCWVRVAQIWAGQNWGAIHIPRVGQEVIVEHLDGDPDRPIITGRVYNTDNMPPYTLPDHRTQSGIKSRSANAGTPNNFNELRFEDLKGKEELHIQAERNMSTLVKHNQSLSVGGDRSVNVTGNETIDIKKKESLTVHEGRMEIIEKGDNLSVQASDKDIEVDGQYTTYSKNMYQVLQGPDNEILLDDSIVSVKNKSCTIKFDDTNATLTAADSITLQCGTAQIKLSKEGTITISGSLKVAVTGGKGSVTLDDSAATIAAPTIKLNS